MRAIQISETGGPEVLKLAELPTPEAGPGEVVVEVGAAGVNYIDTYHRGGVYPMDLPLVLGLEGAGRVTALGEGVTDLAVGDRVAWSDTLGTYAEAVAVPADKAVPVPDGVSDEVAVGALLQGMTAWFLVTTTYPVQPGDDVLVHAAAGGVGLLLTQLATARGARVIGTVSSAEKEELARGAGAADVLRYSDDLAEQVRDLTGGVGVAVAYDGVGAARSTPAWTRCGAAACSCSSGRRAARCRRWIRSGSTQGARSTSPVRRCSTTSTPTRTWWPRQGPSTRPSPTARWTCASLTATRWPTPAPPTRTCTAAARRGS